MSEHIASFLVIHRRADGTPDFVYPWTGRLHACVVVSINVCRRMLRHPKVQSALLSFIRDFNRSTGNSWYMDPRFGLENNEQVVFAFLRSILSVFPTVYVDEAFGYPGCLGCHKRGEWSDTWDPRSQSILINGPRVHDMVSAATRAIPKWNRNDYENKQFRTFIFNFANMFLHEITHVFVTFLNKGRTLTPARMGAQIEGYEIGGHRGESGRNLETILFGGTIEILRDHSHGDEQSGVPHIATKHGLRRISQDSIDSTVDVLRDLHNTPYHLEGPTLDSHTVEYFGSHLQDWMNLTDPLWWPEVRELLRLGRTIRVGPGSALAQFPFRPNLHAEAV